MPFDDEVGRRLHARYGGAGSMLEFHRPVNEAHERWWAHEVNLCDRYRDVGSAEYIRERLQQGLTMEQIALRAGLPVANLESTLRNDEAEKDGVIVWPLAFRSWLDSILSRLTGAAQAALKLVRPAKVGPPITVDREKVRRALIDLNGDAELAALVCDCSVRSVYSIKAEMKREERA